MIAALAVAFVGEMTGRLVGLVSPEPLILVLDFVLWHSLIGVVLIRQFRPIADNPISERNTISVPTALER